MITRKELTPVTFIECPVADVATGRPHVFDVTSNDQGFIVNGRFSMHEYCYCLLNKLLGLNKLHIKPFIKYQKNLLASPDIWLNTLDELIILNGSFLKSGTDQHQCDKVLIIIQLMLDDLDMYVGSLHFNFETIKAKLQTIKEVADKIVYLHEVRADYLQNKPNLVNINEVPFDQKVAIEIDKLEKLSMAGPVKSRKTEEAEPIPCLIDNEEFLKIMNISKRLAATWRESGIIGYCKVGGTIRYLKSDVNALLQKNYFKKM